LQKAVKDMHGQPVIFENIAALMQRVSLPSPLHPLITLVNYDENKPSLADAGSQYLLHFYKIAFKSNFSGKAKYGPGSYDFRDGGLAFVGPNQIVELSDDLEEHEGYALYFTPIFFTNIPLHPAFTDMAFSRIRSLKHCFFPKKRRV
jgi:hypothetical protein